MRKGELFISKQLNYDNKEITGQACLADCMLSNKSAAIFFFDIITLPIYVSESFGYILASTIQKKGKSTYYTKYLSIFVLNIITRYHHIGITIIKQSIELSYKYDNE